MIDKNDAKFDDNKQRQVDWIKGIIYGIENIIEQKKLFVKGENKKINFECFLIDYFSYFIKIFIVYSIKIKKIIKYLILIGNI